MYYDSEEHSSASNSDNEGELDNDDTDDENGDDDERSDAAFGENLRDDLEAAFEGDFEFGGNFAVSKTFTAAPQPGLHIEGIGMIGLPLSEREAKLIEAAAIQAPFGKGTETVVDTTVRDTFEINPDKFSFKNPAWAEFLQQVTKTVAEGLGFPPTRPLPRAEVYKLLLYKTGSHFLPHKDTEKTEGMFASLIIVLPSKFQGGEVHVSHGEHKDIFDISPSSEFSISALAWYTDVIHEVKPVTSGYRLAVSYNLVNPSRGLPAPHLPDMHTAVSGVQRIFRMWAKGEYDTSESSGTIAYLLDHQYSDAGLEFTGLKGRDATLISNIQRVAEKEGICLRLGNLVYEVRGDAGGDYSYGRGVVRMEEVVEADYTIEGLYDLEGDLAKLKRPIALSEEFDLIPKDPFEGESPDDEDFEGYTGNEGAPLTHWYRRTVLVLYLASDKHGKEAPMDIAYALRKLKRRMAEGPTERNRKMAQFVLKNGHLGAVYSGGRRSVPENTLLLIDLALEWNDFAMWAAVLEKSKGDVSPQLLGSAPLIRAWNAFPFNIIRPVFEKLILHQPSTRAEVEFINLLRSSLSQDQQDAATWCTKHMAVVLSSIKQPSTEDVKVFVNIAKTEGLTFFSDTILEQLVKFPRMFDFWVALGEGLWKKRNSLIPSGGTPEERSNSATVLNHILDRLIVTAMPEPDSGADYKPSVYYGGGYRRPNFYNTTAGHPPLDQDHILQLLDLMTLTHRVQHSVQLITLVSRPHEHLLAKYEKLVVPLIPQLKARLPQYDTTESSTPAVFLRTLVERYLQDLLGGPSNQPEAVIKKVNCRCDDCMRVNRFLRSDAVMETFRVAQQRRKHIEEQFRTAVQNGFTFNTIVQGSPHTLQVTKTPETLAAGKWKTRVQKARAFLAAVGTPEQLARIMGDRYPDVQAAVAGTKPYEMGALALVAPPPGGTAGGTTSTVEATTSRTQAGPVVAGVKRKAEDDDVIDLTSD